jgi:hypothetical protein
MFLSARSIAAKAARVLAREGFGARPEQRNEEIFADEGPQGRGVPTDDLRHVSRRPGGLDGIRHGEESGQRKACFQKTRMNPLTDGPDLGLPGSAASV